MITCFDGRVDPRKYSGSQPGDAILISNAGGRVNSDSLCSIIVLDDPLKVGTAIVIQHTDCGLMHTNTESIPARLMERAPERALGIEGMDFQLFEDVHTSIIHDMGVVKASPYLDVQVLGYVYDVTSGTVEEVKI